MGGDKYINFFFRKDKIFLLEHTKRTLSLCHKETHQQVTSYLKVIFNALQKSPKLILSYESEKFNLGI